ncbi:dITP/XTP pyrophosphatase [Spiroplasma sabaudiense Ar-1343]|uniref:dITP/XTP pyrophosphatase n=1 Tax=Spiroplasma sabaudiense Ar-1343 TaxID=1276257 RepID=W6AJQ3_9MOLU|nr:RdgB/HAM1 family non-canonical purine NTP pyrophosphatase [Spiroplasma sabaudiense]AHI53959.1 dITP/XTP pyrophosphatase [Spiroplasma sabaudiense Ar-1343]
MKKTIWVATQNSGKIEDFKNLLPQYQIKSLLDLPTPIEIPEDFLTFEENALFKAQTLSSIINEPVIADDSGLQIDSLQGFPGVHSARWADPIKDWKIINEKLLQKMRENNLVDMSQRQARFITVIAYYDSKLALQKTFRGEVEGEILPQQIGEFGFGYDPIFKPNGQQKSFAQMRLEEKNLYSHRSVACSKLKQFLTN